MDFRHELVLPNEDLPFKLFVFEGKEEAAHGREQ